MIFQANYDYFCFQFLICLLSTCSVFYLQQQHCLKGFIPKFKIFIYIYHILEPHHFYSKSNKTIQPYSCPLIFIYLNNILFLTILNKLLKNNILSIKQTFEFNGHNDGFLPEWIIQQFQLIFNKLQSFNFEMQSVYNAAPEKVIIGMVGLPARGKSYISKKIYRYLNWLGFNSQVFNIGNFRRKYMSENDIELTAEFFNPSNQEHYNLREFIAEKVIEDLVDYINKEQNIVAILDGTNSTASRRKKISKILSESVKSKYQLIWIQSICDNQQQIQDNIRKVKIHGLDYAHMTSQEAEQDFQKRIQQYEKYYEHLDKSEGFPYVKVINVGEGIQSHKILGYLPEKIMAYVINLTLSPNRIIYLSRHGESTYNQQQRIGGNPQLSENGRKYLEAIPKIFSDPYILPQKEQTIILTSTLKRTIQTAQKLELNGIKKIELRILDELNAGICEQLTYADIKNKYPEVAKARDHNKLTFRYPSGESYLDVIGRLEPLIFWIERQKSPIIIFGHQAILRCISGYFFGIQIEKIPYLEVPLHTIVKMTPQTYSFKEEYLIVNIETGQIKREIQAKKKYSIDLDGTLLFKKQTFNSY